MIRKWAASVLQWRWKEQKKFGSKASRHVVCLDLLLGLFYTYFVLLYNLYLQVIKRFFLSLSLFYHTINRPIGCDFFCKFIITAVLCVGIFTIPFPWHTDQIQIQANNNRTKILIKSNSPSYLHNKCLPKGTYTNK